MKTSFRRLVRFKTASGEICYGEAKSCNPEVGSEVDVYHGEVPWELKSSGPKATIAQILSPLPSTPIIYGIGLNYKRHIEEAGLPIPSYPTVFTKPPDALTGPYNAIHIDSDCTNLDYEGELCIIIGKDCKNINPTSESISDYILGYTAGNDVSSRFWQMPDKSGGQHGYAKSFDGFCPIGPMIVSTEVIPDPSKLTLQTFVNGELRQRTDTGDLLFDVEAILQHLSRGTTLRKGTVIMTGTPSGVAAFMKPPSWLKSGDVVEVEISEVGRIRNEMVVQL